MDRKITHRYERPVLPVQCDRNGLDTQPYPRHMSDTCSSGQSSPYEDPQAPPSLSCGQFHPLPRETRFWRPNRLSIGEVRTKGFHACDVLTISSGERIPNWTSLTLRIGAAEYAN